jgi:hypothetical protein
MYDSRSFLRQKVDESGQRTPGNPRSGERSYEAKTYALGSSSAGLLACCFSLPSSSAAA